MSASAVSASASCTPAISAASISRELVAQQVDLARTRPFVAAQPRALVIDATRLVARVADSAARGRRALPARAVEPRALFHGCEQGLVRVLTVQVDEPATQVRELARGREPAIDVPAAAADHRDHAGEHDLVRIVRVGEREPAFDARFLRTIAHRGRIRAPAAQQLERVHQQGLARRSRPVITVMAGPSGTRISSMMPRFSTQFVQHQRSGRANFALEDLVEVARPQLHETRWFRGGPARARSPGSSTRT
jgi:hypothetical protein